MAKKYWLMKSEPEVFSIEDLARDKKTLWEGVRNYQARNFMMKEMSLGDEILFYHSNAQPSGVAGLASVSGLGHADPTQFDKKSDYYDAKSKREQPRWICVEVQFIAKFKNIVSLADIKMHKALKNMGVLKQGNRLSIQPVTKEEFEFVKKLGR